MPKPPSRRSTAGEIQQFLNKSSAIAKVFRQQPRLIFAIDATASRQPTWDKACHLQRDMFDAAAKVSSLSVQLCYFRGFHEFFASPWTTDSRRLGKLMNSVLCEGGHTQIGRLFRHALEEQSKHKVQALVFIGDAMEENPDTLCDLAGQCGLLKLPLFLFQEGGDTRVRQNFMAMSRLSGGAYASFDAHSAKTLGELLGAVASYAAGGRVALERSASDGAKLLLRQLKP